MSKNLTVTAPDSLNDGVGLRQTNNAAGSGQTDNMAVGGQTDKPTFKQKISAFFTDYNNQVDMVCCLGMVIFICMIFAVFLKINGIYPFGKDVMSSYDMLAQVAPFIEHFFDVIDGKSSLFYSFSIAGGADVFGTLAYCCLSPFTFVFLLFGKGNVYYGTSIVLPLKICCVAISGYIYVRKRFSAVSPLIRIALALSYAFCGYLYVANTYISWVDLLIYLPIFAYGFKKLVDTGSKRTFVIGLSLMIYTCFSITCFSLFIVYPLTIAYCYIVLDKEKRRKTIVDIVIAFCLAVAVSLPVLVPALCAYLVSGRSQGLFNGLFGELKPDPVYYKISYIVTDGLTLFFTFAYFIKKGVKRPIDRFLLIAGLITVLPVICDECCIMLNFGSYNSYALRFGFLNGFYFLFVASLYFNGWEREEGKAGERGKKVKKSTKILFTIGLSLLTVAGLIGGYFLCVAAQNDKIEKWFSSRFAHSLGGLEVTAIVLAIVAIIALSVALLKKYRKIFPIAASVILLVVVCGQSAFYAENLVYGNKKETTDFDRIGVYTDYVKTLDGGEYARIKMQSDYLTADMPFTLHTNAYSVFSSVINDKNFVPPRFFSFGGNGSNTIKSYSGMFFGDCLFANRYYISKSSIAERNYKAVEIPANSWVNSADTGDYHLYENTFAFPNAFVIKDVFGSFNDDDTLFVKYDSLVKTLGGESVGVTEKLIRKSMIKEQDDGGYKVSFSMNESGSCFVVLDFENIGDISYSLGVSEKTEKVGVDRSIMLQRGSNKYTSFRLYFNGDKPELDSMAEKIHVYSLTDAAVKEISAVANNNAAKLNLSRGNIYAECTTEDGGYLFLSYIALPGHKATVNGKRVEINDDYLGFMIVPLEKGENNIEIKYSSPYVKYAVFGLIGALIIVFAYCFLLKKRDLSSGKFGVGVRVAAASLCAVVVLVFMVVPVGVFVYKLVMKVVGLISGLF